MTYLRGEMGFAREESKFLELFCAVIWSHFFRTNNGSWSGSHGIKKPWTFSHGGFVTNWCWAWSIKKLSPEFLPSRVDIILLTTRKEVIVNYVMLLYTLSWVEFMDEKYRKILKVWHKERVHILHIITVVKKHCGGRLSNINVQKKYTKTFTAISHSHGLQNI